MSWIKFSNYRKRFWESNYKDAQINLCIVDRQKGFGRYRLLEAAWSTSKLKGVKFSFGFIDTEEDAMKLLMKRLRASLAYGHNIKGRAVADRLLGYKPGDPHPIHNMVRTSSTFNPRP